MNSGAEAVESAIKSVRKWGYEVKGVPDGRAEIITQPAKVIAILFASSGALRQFGNTSSALCNANSATSAGSAFPICHGHGGKSGELHCQFGAAVPGDLVDTPPGKARPRPSLLRPQGSPTPKFPISSNPKQRNCVIRLPPAGRSDDRTQSPASVSQKREYSR